LKVNQSQACCESHLGWNGPCEEIEGKLQFLQTCSQADLTWDGPGQVIDRKRELVDGRQPHDQRRQSSCQRIVPQVEDQHFGGQIRHIHESSVGRVPSRVIVPHDRCVIEGYIHRDINVRGPLHLNGNRLVGP